MENPRLFLREDTRNLTCCANINSVPPLIFKIFERPAVKMCFTSRGIWYQNSSEELLLLFYILYIFYFCLLLFLRHSKNSCCISLSRHLICLTGSLPQNFEDVNKLNPNSPNQDRWQRMSSQGHHNGKRIRHFRFKMLFTFLILFPFKYWGLRNDTSLVTN